MLNPTCVPAASIAVAHWVLFSGSPRPTATHTHTHTSDLLVVSVGAVSLLLPSCAGLQGGYLSPPPWKTAASHSVHLELVGEPAMVCAWHIHAAAAAAQLLDARQMPVASALPSSSKCLFSWSLEQTCYSGRRHHANHVRSGGQRTAWKATLAADSTATLSSAEKPAFS